MPKYEQEVIETRTYRVRYTVEAKNAAEAMDKIAIGDTTSKEVTPMDRLRYNDEATGVIIHDICFHNHEIKALMAKADDTVHLCELVSLSFGVELTLAEATRMESYAEQNGLAPTPILGYAESFLQSCEGVFASLRDQGKLDKAVANGFIRDSKVLRKRLRNAIAD